jgi:hypothetical protein
MIDFGIGKLNAQATKIWQTSLITQLRNSKTQFHVIEISYDSWLKSGDYLDRINCTRQHVPSQFAEPRELDTAQTHLHAPLGQVTLKPKTGVLWAYPTLKAKGLTDASPLRLILVAGRDLCCSDSPSAGAPKVELPLLRRRRVIGLSRGETLRLTYHPVPNIA